MGSFGGTIQAILIGVSIGFGVLSVITMFQVFGTKIEADFSELNKPTDTPAIQLMEFKSNQEKGWDQ